MRHWTIQVSRRYAVVGIYRDRSTDTWRIYPLPFVRLSGERPVVEPIDIHARQRR